MKILFVINPISGKGRGRRPMKMIREIDKEFRKAGHDFVIRIWKRPDEIDEIMDSALNDGFDAVIAAGGDGTINEVGKRLLGTEVALGVIPLGSGNGFARHVGYSRRPLQAIRQLAYASKVPVDTGTFGGMPFMNAAGIGIDAEVADRFSRAGKRGLKTYIRQGVKAFLGYRSQPCRLIVDDERTYEVDKLLLMDIANGTQWGNGAKLSPLSHMSDGWLEAVILEKAHMVQVPRLLKLLFNGKIYRHPNVKIVRGKKFRIERSYSGAAHVDGEPIQLGKTIECCIEEKSVQLLIPRRRSQV